MKPTLALLQMIFVMQIYAQQPNVQERIKSVENNLIPFVPVKGFGGWNITDRMSYYQVPGVSIAVIRNFEIDWAKGYGLADTLKKVPVTTETMFSAGSISKFLMAVTALKMVENKQIDLDEPINNYLTSWRIIENEFTKKTPVSLRMLLSHSAGTSQSSYFGFLPGQPLPSIIDILNGAQNAESRPVVVNSEPGKEFRYSGGGSMIAQLALTDASRKTFTALTQSLLFDQLGMSNSTFEQPVPSKYSGHTSWAYSSVSWFKGVPYVYPQQAAAALYSTPTDLARLFIDIQKSYLGKGKILGEEMVRKMLSPQQNVSDGAYKEQMGIGPFLFQRTDNIDPKGKYFEFTGVNAGFLAYGIASVEGGNGAIIMLNSGDDVNGLGKEIRRAVAKTYGWVNFLPTEIVPVSLADKELDQLTGRYRKAADEVLYLRKEKNYLVEKINDGPEIYCFPISRDTIVFTDYNIKGVFKRNEKGEITSLQNMLQNKQMPKMKDDEFSPGEYLKMKRYAEAKNAFREVKMNEYQVTYLAYELMNKKDSDLNAVKTILDLALEEHPKSPIVHIRLGDYFLKVQNKEAAVKNYQKAIELDPTDLQTKEVLSNLKK